MDTQVHQDHLEKRSHKNSYHALELFGGATSLATYLAGPW
jgi:hypothetical protein